MQSAKRPKGSPPEKRFGDVGGLRGNGLGGRDIILVAVKLTTKGLEEEEEVKKE